LAAIYCNGAWKFAALFRNAIAEIGSKQIWIFWPTYRSEKKLRAFEGLQTLSS
jgi:hypothetical protein